MIKPPPDANKMPDNSLKRKRRPAGTPDPDAEVVSLSPQTLLESDRYVCDICGQGFQREQNLQMHRRRHKVPWKLVKREAGEGAPPRKLVFVCPEPTCLHHDPAHALGDLVGIKKHFRRKHSDRRQWACPRCGRAYAVHSDFKAHVKTCGTRGHSCDCGRVFSRVESFIEHQVTCTAGRAGGELVSPSSRTNFSPEPRLQKPKLPSNIELQLMPASASRASPMLSPASSKAQATELHLSIGVAGQIPAMEKIKEKTREQLGMVEAEKAAAEVAREKAKRELEIAQEEFAEAKRVRQKAQEELSKAFMVREQARKQIESMVFEITCQACRQVFHARPGSSVAECHMSWVVTQAEFSGDEDRRPEDKVVSKTKN